MQRSIFICTDLVLQMHIASIKMPPAHPGWYPELHSFPELTGCIKYTSNEAVTGLWIQRLKKCGIGRICPMFVHNGLFESKRRKGIHFIVVTVFNFYELVSGVPKCSK